VGDTVYWYSNVEMPWVPGYNQGNAFHCIYTYDHLQRLLKGETKRIVPGHDPAIWERHPSWIISGHNQVAELNLAGNEPSRRGKTK
jgi:glyoxylase-like metal-dependent hydrolase (beta-lactamase superfamily II)